jgi:hypothetical protein
VRGWMGPAEAVVGDAKSRARAGGDSSAGPYQGNLKAHSHTSQD